MSTFKQIKAWYKLAKPHKGYLWGAFLTSLFAVGIMIAQAIPNAKVITSLTNMDFNAAIMWLLVSLLCYFLYYFFWHLNYKYYYLQCKYITLHLSERLYNKLDSATEQGLSENSIEKLMMIFTSNVEYIQKFTDFITYETCYIIRAIVTVAIVFAQNIVIGLIMLVIVVLLYFWYVFLANRAQKYTDKVFKERDNLGEKITDIVDGRAYNEKMNLGNENRKQYLMQAKKVVNTYWQRGKINLLRQQWTYAVLYIIVTALTIWLAILTDANSLTLTLYLIIAPYLVDIIDQATTGYEILYELQREDVSRLRIETVLNMPDQDIVSFSNNSTDALTDSLILSNVSYIDTNFGKNKSGNLSPFNLEIKQNSIVLFRGVQNCGKRSIFYMLRRAITPTTGTITMDGINIYDFDKKTYNHNFSYATSKPYFYRESILDNLSYVCPSKKKIVKVCKELEIHTAITTLPNGYDTNMITEAEQFTPYLLFMIGLARAVLSQSEYICIYEFPLSLTKKQQQLIKKHILRLKSNHAIIIFSASDTAIDICDECYSVQSGHVRKLKKVED